MSSDKTFYFRLKTTGFRRVDHEFPTLDMATWTPQDTTQDATNDAGVSVRDVPHAAWVASPEPTLTMNRAAFRHHVALLETEAYVGAGDVWKTYTTLKQHFPRQPDNDEESTLLYEEEEEEEEQDSCDGSRCHGGEDDRGEDEGPVDDEVTGAGTKRVALDDDSSSSSESKAKRSKK
jgi:hypothetical protein